jgi:hypothetical protein
VLSDIVDIACNKATRLPISGRELSTTNPDHSCRNYLRFPVAEPSAIGPVTTILEKNGIGVQRAAATWAKNGHDHSQVRIVTHACSQRVLEKAIEDIGNLPASAGEPLRLPVAE